MGKGSNRRPTDEKVFKANFEKVDFSRHKSKLVAIKTATGTRYVSAESLKERPRSHHIMPDIEPYQPVAGDGAYRAVITSRSKQREYLKRNRLIEVGNEKDYFFRNGGKTDDNPTKDW